MERSLRREHHAKASSRFDAPFGGIGFSRLIADALDAMFTWPGPYLLHVRIDETDNVWPLVPPGAANHDMMTDLPQWEE